VDVVLHCAGVRRHDDYAIGEIDRLGHVVCDVDDRFAGGVPNVREQPLHLLARQRVEGREGFVHEQNGRIVGKGAGDGDTLLHAAGEVMRVGACK